MIALVGTTDEITSAQSSAAYTELLKLITADRIIRSDTITVLDEDLARLKERFTTDIDDYSKEKTTDSLMLLDLDEGDLDEGDFINLQEFKW